MNLNFSHTHLVIKRWWLNHRMPTPTCWNFFFLLFFTPATYQFTCLHVLQVLSSYVTIWKYQYHLFIILDVIYLAWNIWDSQVKFLKSQILFLLNHAEYFATTHQSYVYRFSKLCWHLFPKHLVVILDVIYLLLETFGTRINVPWISNVIYFC